MLEASAAAFKIICPLSRPNRKLHPLKRQPQFKAIASSRGSKPVGFGPPSAATGASPMVEARPTSSGSGLGTASSTSTSSAEDGRLHLRTDLSSTSVKESDATSFVRKPPSGMAPEDRPRRPWRRQ
ncbi:OLC1v1012017C1 [Oldenlandia corymbosa var. corymbosa]|uniref:OLC1v1012017C1 n=1 Tax=Oldenlandia corymbosa var. corymbosa TaxID=529605 RepID=A0AAV1DV15_OLDCO|nr:OLC1v1012017C1 [Oldenlandia corymbosa var. corymbosa]